MNDIKIDDIDLAIFDMDGLLFDTEKLFYKGSKEITKSYGYELTERFGKSYIGMNQKSLKKLYTEEYGDDFPFEKFLKKMNEYMLDSAHRGKLELKQGVMEALEFFKKNDKKISLGTSANRRKANLFLKKGGIEEYFNFITTGEDVTNGKPDPEVFTRTLKKEKVHPSKAIILEDSLNGIRAAYSSGALPIMIPDLVPPTEEIEKMYFKKFDNLNQMINYFK